MKKNSEGRYVIDFSRPQTPAQEKPPKAKSPKPGPFKLAKAMLHHFWRCDRQRGLSPAARCAWLWLWSIMDSDHKARSSYSTIGTVCGNSTRTARRSITELIKHGFIEITRRGSSASGNKSNEYRVKCD